MTGHTNTGPDLSLIAVPLVIGCFSLVLAQWATATIGAFLIGAGRLDANLADAARALAALPNNASNPAAAWTPDLARQLPGAWLYWPLAAVVHAALAAAAHFAYQLLTRTPNAIDRRKRLGVETQARVATRTDTRPLRSRKPEPGRYRLGHAHGSRLATEPRPETAHRRSNRHRTTPGAVAIIAPSRSGKTVSTITAANQWQGPAILSSVKRDLIDGTLEQRARMGEVRIYDPKAVASQTRHSWTPLRRARTLSGSTQMARILLGANGHDTTGNGAFWTHQAEGFLAALLWLAANTDHTIADVAYWIAEHDQPVGNDPGTAAGLLRALINSDDELATDAKQIHRQLRGIWAMDKRMASSYYVTARLAVNPWTDPTVAETAVTNEIDLDWLASGDNTLYIVAPVADQATIAPALGGLIGDLVTQTIELVDTHQTELERPLLVALDEAANTPITQLPQWASLLTGYRIQLVTIWQAKSQIDNLYGAVGDALLTNHRSKIFYGGTTDLATLDYVNHLLGHEHQSAHLARHRHIDQRDPPAALVQLTPPNVVRSIPTGEALLIHGSLPPIHLTRT